VTIRDRSNIKQIVFVCVFGVPFAALAQTAPPSADPSVSLPVPIVAAPTPPVSGVVAVPAIPLDPIRAEILAKDLDELCHDAYRTVGQ
jgi:hypothetical protein